MGKPLIFRQSDGFEKIRSVKEKYLTAALFSDTITQVVVK